MIPARWDAYSPVRHLAYSIWLDHNPARRRMVMYSAYYDASSDQAALDDPLVIAGLVSTVDRWTRFEVEWSEVLARPEFNVPYFHFTDFISAGREFKGWRDDDDRRDELIRSLIPVLRRGVEHGEVFHMLPHDYHEVDARYDFALLHKSVAKPLQSYSWSAFQCAIAMHHWLEETHPNDPANHVIERGDLGQGSLRGMAPLLSRWTKVLQQMARRSKSACMARPSSIHDAFTRGDRRRLARALARTTLARTYRRLAALLAIAEGDSIAAVSRRTRVDRATVHRWVERYLATRDPTALADGPRTGRPRARALTDQRLVRLLATDPRRLGYQTATWTTPLLAGHCAAHFNCVVSARTLRRWLHEQGYRWKRPRYRYAHRAAHLAQKKGLSAVA